MSKPLRYHLWTIGCQMNEADSERASAVLDTFDWQQTHKAEEADLLLMNTCVVRQQAEDKIYSRLDYVQSLKKKNPHLVVALMGCLVGKSKKHLDDLKARFPYVDLWLPPSDVTPLVQHIQAHSGAADTVNPRDIPSVSTHAAIVSYIPIVLGCSHACTYCVIPYRRGGERSRPSADILHDAARLAAQGTKEIILLGQIVDRYGLDVPGEILLPDLLKKIGDIDGIQRIRFLTSHPTWITPELIDTVATHPKLCPHFEIPVQAGSDAVLHNMKRGYTADEYRALVACIRDRIPGASIYTDIIVGFPGETDAQFGDTLTLMRDIRPQMIRIAKYSPRPLTYAMRHLPDDVPEDEKERRRIALDALLRDLLTEENAALLDTTHDILVESVEKNGRRRGRTPTYKQIFVEHTDAAPGQLLKTRITHTAPYSLIGIPAPDIQTL